MILTLYEEPGGVMVNAKETVIVPIELQVRARGQILNRHFNSYPSNELITLAMRARKRYLKACDGGIETI